MILALALAALNPSPPALSDELSWVAVPMFGADSDLGFVLGMLGVLTKPDGDNDFHWQLQAHSSTSLKTVDDETFWPLQRHFLRFEKPQLKPGLALWLEARFERVLDAGYFGLQSGSAERLDPAPTTDYYQYQSTEPHLRGYLSGQFMASKHWRWLGGLDLKYASAVAPAGSQLELDFDQEPRLVGAEPHFTLQPWLGLAFDDRNQRFETRKGSRHLFTLRGAPGLFSSEIGFVGASALLRQYWSLSSSTVFAYRVWLDALFGAIPFEELARGGDLRQTRMIGHSRSFRGIPWGRVHAPFKAISSVELRQQLMRIKRTKKPAFKVNFNLFAEAGRGWWDFDEGGEMAWAVGFGPRFILAPGVNLRVDWAYSPVSEPLDDGIFTGFYIDLGEVF